MTVTTCSVVKHFNVIEHIGRAISRILRSGESWSMVIRPASKSMRPWSMAGHNQPPQTCAAHPRSPWRPIVFYARSASRIIPMRFFPQPCKTATPAAQIVNQNLIRSSHICAAKLQARPRCCVTNLTNSNLGTPGAPSCPPCADSYRYCPRSRHRPSSRWSCSGTEI